MDQDWAKPSGKSGQVSDLLARFTLPSRIAALDAIVPALRSQLGAVLITGDAGVGKTWLRNRVQAELPTNWHGVTIDPSPATDAGEFYRLLAYSLGLSPTRNLVGSRIEIADFLKESSADGLAWLLAVDEAHGLGNEVLEEIRVLSNRIGSPDGFAGLILIGQTPLARRISSRPLAALSARIAARTHLRSLDLEEARALIEQVAPKFFIEDNAWEFLHRETGGSPKRILNAARFQCSIAPLTRTDSTSIEHAPTPTRLPPQTQSDVPHAPVPAPHLAQPIETRKTDTWNGPVLGEGKPPLRMEEGLIEVGWDSESESEADAEADHRLAVAENDESDGLAGGEVEDAATQLEDEAIHDRYAALQAWNEWARNQGRAATVPEGKVSTDEPVLPENERLLQAEGLELPPESTSVAPGVWAEGQQQFAPYGQLFTRLKQRRDSNER